MGRASWSNVPLEVTLSRSCARPGDAMTVTAATVRDAMVAFTAYYGQRGDTPPDFGYVPREGNKTGTVSWSWVVRPDATPGNWHVTVVVGVDNDLRSYFFGADGSTRWNRAALEQSVILVPTSDVDKGNVTADGDRLGKVRVPQTVANLTFGGPRRNRLFIAATTSLYAVYVTATGVQAP